MSSITSASTSMPFCQVRRLTTQKIGPGERSKPKRAHSACLLASAALLLLVALGWLPGAAALALVALAGAGIGIAGPSRDMLIKRAAPPGATGRVYGTVYSGLDLGFAVAAPLFGALLDRGQTAAIFYGSALALVLGVASAGLVGAGVAARAARPVGASA